MSEPYCMPIIKDSQAKVLDAIRDNKRLFSFFEVWLDYIEDLNDAFVLRVATELSGRVVFVFRRQQLAPITMPLADRLRLLSLLSGSAALVDLDLYSQQSELAHIKENSLAIRRIICHHDYDLTPGTARLRQITSDMKPWQPDIIKLATFCNTEEDAVRLLSLQLKLRREGQKHIILGMGAHGAVTRIFGTMWGNELIFAPSSSVNQSAPGQLTREELDAIFTTLNKAELRSRD